MEANIRELRLDARVAMARARRRVRGVCRRSEAKELAGGRGREQAREWRGDKGDQGEIGWASEHRSPGRFDSRSVVWPEFSRGPKPRASRRLCRCGLVRPTGLRRLATAGGDGRRPPAGEPRVGNLALRSRLAVKYRGLVESPCRRSKISERGGEGRRWGGGEPPDGLGSRATVLQFLSRTGPPHPSLNGASACRGSNRGRELRGPPGLRVGVIMSARGRRPERPGGCSVGAGVRPRHAQPLALSGAAAARPHD